MTTSEPKCRFFLENESIRIDSLNESNRIANWNALPYTGQLPTKGAFSVTRPTPSVMSPTKRESSLQCIKTRKTSFKNVVRTSKTYVSPCRTCRKKEEALLSWHCSHWHAHKCIQKEWCSLSQTLTAETFCSIKRFVSKTANLHDKKPPTAF